MSEPKNSFTGKCSENEEGESSDLSVPRSLLVSEFEKNMPKYEGNQKDEIENLQEFDQTDSRHTEENLEVKRNLSLDSETPDKGSLIEISESKPDLLIQADSKNPDIISGVAQKYVLDADCDLEIEGKLTFSSRDCVDKQSEEFSASEYHIDAGIIGNISASERNLDLDVTVQVEKNLDELSVSESESEEIISPEDISILKRKFGCEAKDKIPGYSKDMSTLESPKKFAKVITADSVVDDQVASKLSVHELQETQFYIRDFRSEVKDTEPFNVDGNEKSENNQDGKLENTEIDQATEPIDEEISIPEKQLDLVQLYRIQKWLKGISTFDWNEREIFKGDPNNNESVSSSKRKFEEKDPNPGCSKSDPSESPNKVLKTTPEQENFSSISSNSEFMEPGDTRHCTCSTCLQRLSIYDVLDENKASYGNQSNKDLTLDSKDRRGREGKDSLQGTFQLISREFSSFNSPPTETVLGEYSIATFQRVDNVDYPLPDFICPECGCSLPRSNPGLCYHHAVACFFANTSLQNNIPKRKEMLDSEENFSVTNSEDSLSSEFLCNMMNFYMAEFMRSTIAVSYFSEENNSSDESNYQCPICLQALKNQSLRDHIKSLHVSNSFSSKDVARELSADASKHDFVQGRVFRCIKCGEKFSSRDGIKWHAETYLNGDCCPRSSQIGESIEQSPSNKDFLRSLQNFESIEQTTANTGCSEFSQTAESFEQTSAAADFPGVLQTSESIEQIAADRGCCPGFTQTENSKECKTTSTACCPVSLQISEIVQQGEETSKNADGYSRQQSNNWVEETAFTCRFCYYACENLDDMVEHYSIHELLRVCYPQDVRVTAPLSNHPCPVCLKQFDNLIDTLEHIDLVQRRQHTCPICHEFLTSKASYDNHFQVHTLDIIKLYRDSLNQPKNDSTNSNEDQSNTKVTPKRRKRRSKKTPRSEKSPLAHKTYHSPNATKQVEVLQSKLSADTNEPCDQSRLNEKGGISNDRSTENSSYKIIFSYGIKEDSCKDMSYDRDVVKNLECKGANNNSDENTEAHITVGIPSSHQYIRLPDAPQGVSSAKACYNKEDDKVENSAGQHDKSNENQQKSTEITPSKTLPQTPDVFSKIVSSDQNSKIEGSKKFEEFTSVSSSNIQSTKALSENVPSDQEDKNIGKFKKLEETMSVTSSNIQISKTISESASSDQEDNNIGKSKKIEQTTPVTSSNIHISKALSSNNSSDQKDNNIEKSKNLEETTPVSTSNIQISKVLVTNSSSDSDDTITELSQKSPAQKKVVRNLEHLSVASSSTPQIIDLPNEQQLIFTYTSDQEDIEKEGNESEKDLEDHPKIVRSSQNAPSSPLSRVKKVTSTDTYDADVSSTNVSSDEHEFIHFQFSGTYVKRPKKQRDFNILAIEHPLRCLKCNITFQLASNLVAHNLMHSIYTCHKCNERFSLKSAFLDHLAYHTGRKPFACFHCFMSFATTLDLKIHRKSCRDRKRDA